MTYNAEDIVKIPKRLSELLYQRLEQMAIEKYKQIVKYQDYLTPILYANKET